MAAPIGPRPNACSMTPPSTAKASCENIDKLNDYGADGTVVTGENADLANMEGDPMLQIARARRAKTGSPAPLLKDSATLLLDTRAWLAAPANQRPSSTNWFVRGFDAVFGLSKDDVVGNLAKAKRNAAEFVRNLYEAQGGEIRDPITGEKMVIRIVPTEESEIQHAPLIDGKVLPWSERDNLRKTRDGVDILINARTLEVPSAEELTKQWNKGMQFDDETMRKGWTLLNPNGAVQSGIGLLHSALKTTLGSVASTLIKDLSDAQALLGKDDVAKGGVNVPQLSVGSGAASAPSLKVGAGAAAAVDPELAAKEKLFSVVRRETTQRSAAKGQSPETSTQLGSVEKIINSMSRKELRAFITAWTKRIEDPKVQDDAISAAAQITRNSIIKSKADASGGTWANVAIANGHDIDIVAQVAAKGNGLRFTHLIDAPVQTVDIQTEAKATGPGKVSVAVSTPDAIRVFAQVGGVLGESKVLGTGTLQEALTEFMAARKKLTKK